jgi:hypothetical protein
MVALQTYLQGIPDVRRTQGQRYKLEAMVMFFIICILSGRTKYREMERYGKRHEEMFRELLGLKHGTPSNVSIRAIIRTLNWKAAQEAFNTWMFAVMAERSQDEANDDQASLLARVINFDGKSLRATLEDYDKEYQNFVCFLHGFLAQSGILVHVHEYQNGHQSEQKELQILLESFRLKGYIFTLDALHTQKKR